MYQDKYVFFENSSIALALIGKFVAIDQPSGTLFIECDSCDDALDVFIDEYMAYAND